MIKEDATTTPLVPRPGYKSVLATAHQSFRVRHRAGSERNRSYSKHEGFLDRYSWIRTEVLYGDKGMKELLAEQASLRRALKEMNQQLAEQLREKAVTFRPKVEFESKPDSGLAVLQRQLQNGRVMISNLKIASQQLDERLQFVKQPDIYFSLQSSISEAKEHIELAKRDVKDQKRFNSLRNRHLGEPAESQWSKLLAQLSMLNKKKTKLAQNLHNTKINMERTQQQLIQAERAISTLESGLPQLGDSESQAFEAAQLEQKCERLRRNKESLQKQLKSSKEVGQREYLRKLQSLQKSINSINEASNRLQQLAKQLSDQNESMRTTGTTGSKGTIEMLLQADKRRAEAKTEQAAGEAEAKVIKIGNEVCMITELTEVQEEGWREYKPETKRVESWGDNWDQKEELDLSY